MKKQYDRAYPVDESKLYRNRWLFIEEGLHRGYSIKKIHLKKLIFHVEKNGEGFIYNTLPGSVTARARFPHITDKIYQKRIMDRSGIAVAKTFTRVKKIDDITSFTNNFPCVIKPAVGSRSENVVVNAKTIEDVKMAVQKIIDIKSVAIIEQMYTGLEYRILAVGGKFVSCVQRRPASIVGDGVHTIQELIDIKNSDINRGVRTSMAHTLHNIIVDKSVRDKLIKDDLVLDSIMNINEVVTITTKIDTSVGADLVDCTKDIHKGFVQLCEHFVQKHNFFIIGFDVIAQDITQSPKGQKYIFNELNEQPFFDINEKCNIGEGVPVSSIMWDEIEKSNIMTDKFLIF